MPADASSLSVNGPSMLLRHAAASGACPAHLLLMAISSRWLSFPVLLGIAWAMTACFLLSARWPEMAQRLFDTDDAMRLVQVREFIDGRGWFDLYEPRLAPPAGYDTH